MPRPHDSSRNFILVGNLPCLDLVNTRPLRHGEPEELLATFADLVAWLERAGLIDGEASRRALRRWDGKAAGDRVLQAARELREELREVAPRLAEGGKAGGGLVRAINAVLASKPVVTMLAAEGREWRMEERAVSVQPLHLLVPVARSAAWLIEHGEPDLLRKCEDPACVLWFYDTTRNKRRRWCSMDGCGARAKAAAYYRREKQRR
ncbi:MAG TPA: ABATE domain-containing protein [Gemmatimonadales bacterium]|nr:ABATE domain-containing protein [Gemmatimonadales bacterium]